MFASRLVVAVLAALVLVGPARAETWERSTRPWVTLADCRLVPSFGNDGDSFHVRSGNREFRFRLYAVDTPEGTLTYRERAADQARHFGIPIEQVPALGRRATEFSRRFLSGRFIVETCWQDAKGDGREPRYFAIVRANGRDLAEELAAAGLARVYGFDPERPGFSKERLLAAERRARDQRLGGYDRKAAATSSRLAVSATPRPLSASTGRINLNAASFEQLAQLPGIGPTYAEAIIAQRPYARVEDVLRVKGIGEKTLAKFADRVTVR